jgi:hypothetical protein
MRKEPLKKLHQSAIKLIALNLLVFFGVLIAFSLANSQVNSANSDSVWLSVTPSSPIIICCDTTRTLTITVLFSNCVVEDTVILWVKNKPPFDSCNVSDTLRNECICGSPRMIEHLCLKPLQRDCGIYNFKFIAVIRFNTVKCEVEYDYTVMVVKDTTQRLNICVRPDTIIEGFVNRCLTCTVAVLDTNLTCDSLIWTCSSEPPLTCNDDSLCNKLGAAECSSGVWQRVFSWTPTFCDTGEYTVKFKVSNSIDDSDSCNLHLIVYHRPFILPEPEYTQGLFNTIYWLPMRDAYHQEVCYFDTLYPGSILGCLDRRKSIYIAETLSMTFEDLEDAHTYGYFVTAWLNDSDFVESDTVYSTQDCSPPYTVDNIRAKADSGGHIHLYWEGVCDAISFVSGYNIYRRENGDSYGSDPIAFIPRDTSILDTSSNIICDTANYIYEDTLGSGSGLIEGKLYYFKVRAVDTVGNEGKSIESNGIIPDSTPPCAPEITWWADYKCYANYYKKGVKNTICAKDTCACLSYPEVRTAHFIRFQAVRDSLKFFNDQWKPDTMFFDSGWLSYYSLEVSLLPFDSTCGSVCYEIDLIKNVNDDTSFVHGHKYFYRVQTKDSLGNRSEWSDTVNAYQDGFPPSDINNLKVEGKVDALKNLAYMEITWNSAIDSVSGVDYYTVCRKVGKSGTWMLAGKVFQDYDGCTPDPSRICFQDSMLDTSTVICYKIGSVDRVGNVRRYFNSAWEDCDRCLLGPNIEITSYDAIINSVKYTAQNYAIVCWYGYDKTGVAHFEIGVNGTPDTVPVQNDCYTMNLERDTVYTVEVRAIFANSKISTWSKSDSIIRCTTPPDSLQLTVNNDTSYTGYMYLCWTPCDTAYLACDSSIIPIDHYEIYRWKSENNIPGTPYAVVTDTCYWEDNDTTMTVYQCYNYKIHVVNVLEKDSWSNVGSNYCNRAPEIDSIAVEIGQIRICWERAEPTLVDSVVFDVEVCNGLMNTVYYDHHETCYELNNPPPHKVYTFRVRERLSNSLSGSCYDDSVRSAWSKPVRAPYLIWPPYVKSIITQPQPAPPLGSCIDLNDYPRSDSGRIFLHWEVDTTQTDVTTVDHFEIYRWIDPDNEEFVDTVPALIDTFMDDSLTTNVLYTYTVVPVDEFDNRRLDNVEASAEIDPYWYYTPQIYPFPEIRKGGPSYFNDDALTVRWVWLDSTGNKIDTTFGADLCQIQIGTDPNFAYNDHVTSSEWVLAIRESIDNFPLPDYVNDNNNIVYTRVRAQDKWGHLSPWSTEYFCPPESTIYDAVPPPPLVNLPDTNNIRIDSTTASERVSGSIDVWISWNDVRDKLSGTWYYDIYRCDLLVHSDTSRVSQHIYLDKNLPADSTLLDFCWYVLPVDSVGNKQTYCDTVRLQFYVEPPETLMVKGQKSLCWSPVGTPVPADSYWVEIVDDLDHFGSSIPGLVIKSGWIADICFADTSNWQSEDGITYFRVKARFLNFESGWSEIHKYPPKRLQKGDILAGFEKVVPTVFALNQNYPNPFTTRTTICYQLPIGGLVCVNIFNLTGQIIKTLVNEYKLPGFYSTCWDGLDDMGQKLPSGIYFCKVKLIHEHKLTFVETRKILLLR